MTVTKVTATKMRRFSRGRDLADKYKLVVEFVATFASEAQARRDQLYNTSGYQLLVEFITKFCLGGAGLDR